MSSLIAAHPTYYRSTRFRSRLEARWAAFFDLLQWQWQYEPIDFKDWVPDFHVEFPCGHSECAGSHAFYAEVKPYYTLQEFAGHPVARGDCSQRYGLDGMRLGINPSVVYTEFAHGAGGNFYGDEELFLQWGHPKDPVEMPGFTWDVHALWREAGNLTQWKGEGR